MRVRRALDKLRAYFSKRGVNSIAETIAGAISANSIQTAPAMLAKTATAAALAKGAMASIPTTTLIKGALKIMAWTKAKATLAIGAAVILTAGTTATIIIHHRTHPVIFSSTRELSAVDDSKFASLTGVAPAQAAKDFLEACGREDWATAGNYWPPELLKKNPAFADTFKNAYGGLEIVSLGKPFKGRLALFAGREYPGVYVPYEIRLKSGGIKKWQMAIRCDNAQHRWYWDGGM